MKKDIDIEYAFNRVKDGSNMKQLARELGVSLSTFHRKITTYQPYLEWREGRSAKKPKHKEFDIEYAFNRVKKTLDMRQVAQELSVTYLMLFYKLNMYEPYKEWRVTKHPRKTKYKDIAAKREAVKSDYTDCLHAPEKWDYRII